MSKTNEIATIIIGVIMVYIPLAIFIEFVANQSVTTNATLAAAHNMAQYPGTSGFLLSTPWLLYFFPAIIGIILIIVALKRRSA